VRERGVESMLLPLLETAPDATRSLFTKELERLAGADSAPAPVAMFGFFWLASGSVHGIMNGIEKVEHKAPRPWFRKRLLALGWVALLLAVVTGTAWTQVQWEEVSLSDFHGAGIGQIAGQMAGQVAERAVHTAKSPRKVMRLARAPKKRQIALLVSSLVVGTLTLAVFYRYAAKREQSERYRAWPGAVLALLVWIVASSLFSLYVSSLGKYTLFYGSVATVAVVLVWFWLIGIALLAGAELNEQLSK
jgi:membrane protein